MGARDRPGLPVHLLAGGRAPGAPVDKGFLSPRVPVTDGERDRRPHKRSEQRALVGRHDTTLLDSLTHRH